ncbi:MAG TPA: glycosyltransferase family 87 protein [Candidatus Dormibacteraeota bacterium]|nr:glycosyltransferase family 87 protein [Candidatus Dormibacteraeota bacterium]
MTRRQVVYVPVVLLLIATTFVSYTADFGLAYQAGVEAWNSGHPQRLLTWTGTPFYVLVMALVARGPSVEGGARLFLAISILTWGAMLRQTWNLLMDRVSVRFWWITLAAAVIFSPGIQTIFWLQPNLIVFGLALLGYGYLVILRRDFTAGALIGASIAIKPLVVLLPLALLLRRQTRTAGLWAIASAASLTFVGLAFLAWRAGDPAVLNPIAYLTGFLSKGQGPIAACVPENYSPVALLCRLGIAPTFGTAVVVAVVVLIAWWFITRSLPDVPESDWAIFAAASIFSGLLGPIDWAHYGVLMAPLFLLLAYQFWRENAPPPFWIGLGVAYLLAELVWDPLESLAQTPVLVVIFSYSAGQFSQYVLLLLWARWRVFRRVRAGSRTSAMRMPAPQQ